MSKKKHRSWERRAKSPYQRKSKEAVAEEVTEFEEDIDDLIAEANAILAEDDYDPRFRLDPNRIKRFSQY